jgi:hypothetical protein
MLATNCHGFTKTTLDGGHGKVALTGLHILLMGVMIFAILYHISRKHAYN